MIPFNIGLSAVAAGTADVITATYAPAITLSDRRIVFLTGCSANTTTTPTFNPNTLGANVIKGKGGAALKAGEITGDCILIYHTTGTYWELLTSNYRPEVDAAITTAASDATTKANAALSSANSYTDTASSNASVIAKLLTAFSAGAGTVSASDSILTAFQKVVGNIALKLTANASITGATKTKITYDANGLVTSGADATTADIADSTNKRYVTDANLTTIGNQSGINTGDNSANSLYASLLNAPKTAIVITNVITHTGGINGAETIVFNTSLNFTGRISAGDLLMMLLGVQGSNTGNNKTINIYFSDSATSLSNQVLVGSYVFTTAVVNTAEMTKVMAMKTISTQNVISGTAIGVATGATMGTTAIDFTSVAKYIVITITLAVNTDTVKLQFGRFIINSPW